MKNLSFLFSIVFLFLCSTSWANKTITIHMAGDSTMSVKPEQAYPETGWGMAFAMLFDEYTAVKNYAKNGRSSKSFIQEKRWQEILENIKQGDFVVIQFGHNDEFKSKKERYTTPEEYKLNLKKFIADTRKAQAEPILLSSVTRRHFDEFGKIKLTHPHAPYAREVAQETGVYFIDMDKLSREHFQAMGEINSALRFLHVKPNTLPHFPNGIRDDTHLSSLGAQEISQLVIKHFIDHQHPLAGRLRKATEKQAKKTYLLPAVKKP